MSILDYFIKRKVRTTCDEVVRRELPKIVSRVADDIIADLWRTDPMFRFIKWTQQRLQEADKTLTDKAAFHMAKACIRDHLHDEKIEFGDPAYAWNRDGARQVAEAYEIDHWEKAA